MQNLIKFHQFIHKLLSGNEILTITKGRNYVIYLWKLTLNNPYLDLVNANAYTKSGLIPSIPSEEIDRKRPE